MSESYAQERVSYEDCIKVASVSNSSLPRRTDKVTTLTGVGCRQEAGRVIYVFNYSLDVQKSSMPKSFVKDFTHETRNELCTTPSYRNYLKLVDLESMYYDFYHVFIGKIITTEKDCN